jgi:oxygen-independent coproporphyrinogen-3 oxidase
MKTQKLKVDIDLLKKYDRPGPRYTSYPTAPYFHDGIGADAFREHLKEDSNNRQDEDISLYFHLPFCDTLCYFCGCNMLVTHNPGRIEEYITYLIREIELLGRELSPGRKVAQLHWGGGTPTYLPPEQIRRLGHAIHKAFAFTEDAEVSVEMDPRELTRDHMLALQEVGFNRCSMGVQDFDPVVQKAVNRIQPETITRQTVEWARELGFISVNLDLMYGLPFQTYENFEKTLDQVLDLNPDRFAVFNYAHLPKMIKHQRIIKDEVLPPPEEKLRILKLSIEKLTESGYVYIGMDHFAKPDDELTVAMNNGTLYRNFQGYSTHAGLDLFALGMSSISMLSRLYVQNYKKLNEYYTRIDAGTLPVMRGVVLTDDDVLRRRVIMELMCNFRLTKAKIEQEFGISFDSYFSEALKELKSFEKDNLIELSEKAIHITDPGRLLIRNIAMNFDAYLSTKSEDKPQFSRTV